MQRSLSEHFCFSQERRAPLITIAIPDISIGGAEIVNITLGYQFLRRGFRVDIVTAQDVPEPKLGIPSAARYIVLERKAGPEISCFPSPAICAVNDPTSLSRQCGRSRRLACWRIDL